MSSATHVIGVRIAALTVMLSCLLGGTASSEDPEYSDREKEALGLIQSGEVMRGNGNFAGADREFAKAIEMAPNLEEGWYIRLENMSLEMLSRIDADDVSARYEWLLKSLKFGEQAYRAHPRSGRIAGHMGWLYFNKMGPHAASESYSLYLNRRLWFGTGRGAGEEALRWFKRAAANGPHPVFTPWYTDLNVARAYPKAIQEKTYQRCFDEARHLVDEGSRCIRALLLKYGEDKRRKGELESRLKRLVKLRKELPPIRRPSESEQVSPAASGSEQPAEARASCEETTLPQQ